MRVGAELDIKQIDEIYERAHGRAMQEVEVMPVWDFFELEIEEVEAKADMVQLDTQEREVATTTMSLAERITGRSRVPGPTESLANAGPSAEAEAAELAVVKEAEEEAASRAAKNAARRQANIRNQDKRQANNRLNYRHEETAARAGENTANEREPNSPSPNPEPATPSGDRNVDVVIALNTTVDTSSKTIHHAQDRDELVWLIVAAVAAFFMLGLSGDVFAIVPFAMLLVFLLAILTTVN